MTETEYKDFIDRHTYDDTMCMGCIGNMVCSDDWKHRWFAAKYRCGLPELVSDHSADVRMEVARQKYGLDKLVNDEDPRVRAIAEEYQNKSWEEVYGEYQAYDIDHYWIFELLRNPHIDQLFDDDAIQGMYKTLFDGDETWIKVYKSCCPEFVLQSIEKNDIDLSCSIILCSSNKNGREIKKFLTEKLGDKARAVKIETPESMSAILLRKYADKVGIPSNFEITESYAHDNQISIKNLVDNAFALMMDNPDVLQEVNDRFKWLIFEEGDCYRTEGEKRVNFCDMLYFYKDVGDWCWELVPETIDSIKETIDTIYKSRDIAQRKELEDKLKKYSQNGTTDCSFKHTGFLDDLLFDMHWWDVDFINIPKSQLFELAKYAIKKMRENGV